MTDIMADRRMHEKTGNLGHEGAAEAISCFFEKKGRGVGGGWRALLVAEGAV